MLRMKGSKLLVAVLVPVLIIGGAVFLVANYQRIFIDPTIPTKPVAYTQSESPYGKYKCVVTQYPPSRGSTYNYLFTIKDRATDSELKGKPFMHATDSVPSGALRFEWSGDELIVTEVNSSQPYIVANAKIDKGEQHWASSTSR